MKYLFSFFFLLFGSLSICASDTKGPVIDSFSFTPKTVDVTSSNQVVTFEAHATDETGVKKFEVCVYNPQESGKTMRYGQFSLVSGDKKDGIYQATINISQNEMPGQWNVSVINIKDELDNSGTITCNVGKLTVLNNTEAGIHDCYYNKNNKKQQVYSLGGMKLSNNHSGIVIINGIKLINK